VFNRIQRTYRYYLSSALLQGTAERAGSLRRVPASEIETLVIKSVRDHLRPVQPIYHRSLVHTHVARVEVQPGRLVIQLAEPLSVRRSTLNSTLLAIQRSIGASTLALALSRLALLI
jgi:hypothetical protein